MYGTVCIPTSIITTIASTPTTSTAFIAFIVVAVVAVVAVAVVMFGGQFAIFDIEERGIGKSGGGGSGGGFEVVVTINLHVVVGNP